MPNGSEYKKKASVTITYDAGTGDVDVSEDPVRIRPRGEIDWQCDQGDWEVAVDDDDTLFDNGNTVHGKSGEKKGGRVRPDANHGHPHGRHYKYTVSVRVDGNTVEKDPEVIVGPDEGGG